MDLVFEKLNKILNFSFKVIGSFALLRFLKLKIKNSFKVRDTAWPCLILNILVKGYDNACGAVVFEIQIAFPERFEAIHMLFVFSIFGFKIKFSKLEKAYCKDFFEYSILFSFDFKDNIDSMAWAIASKPDEALISNFKSTINSGMRKNKSGFNASSSSEYLILSTYNTALFVTSAPEPAVVGIAHNKVFFLKIKF